MRNVDLTPYDGETIVAYWRIQSGRIVGALFCDDNRNYRYRVDNGGGYLTIPKVDVILGNDSKVAIGEMNRKILESYKSATYRYGAPSFLVC